jgi:flagellum-specific ATP synthase
MNEPVADTVRSILDGHIILSRSLAAQNHYPAIDVLASVSRIMLDIAEKGHWDASQEMRKVLAVYNDAQDLINIGAYVAGSNPEIDNAIKLINPSREFLRQGVYEKTDYDSCIRQLCSLFTPPPKEAPPPAAKERGEESGFWPGLHGGSLDIRLR